MAWFFGFKLHLVINDRGEILAFQSTPVNVDDRAPLPTLSKDLIGKIEFNYADQSNFTLEKQDEKWIFQSGTPADSAKMATYLSRISRLRGKEFAAKEKLPSVENASLTLTYDGSKMVDVKLYLPDTSSTYIYSSQNPTNIFNDSDQKLKEKLFVSEDYFIENK